MLHQPDISTLEKALKILQRVEDRGLNQTQAATMLGMTPRQLPSPAKICCRVLGDSLRAVR
jgi:hypothetical protein